MAIAIREFRAEAKFQRVSPQKARLVLDLIRGRRVGDALETVAFTRKRVAPLVEKVLRSAVQNANHLSEEQGLDLDVDNLFVKQAIANEGPRMKRIRPAPMGRAYRYQRRMSHIMISVAERGQSSNLVTTVGDHEHDAAAAGKTKSRGQASRRPSPKKSGAKKTTGRKKDSKQSAKSTGKKSTQKFTGTRKSGKS